MTRRPRWQQEDPRFGEESKRYEKPIPSRELLLAKLAEASRPLGFDPLAALLGIRDPEERQALSKRLGAMARDGELLVNRANEYCLVDRLPVIVGTVSGHRDGFGFLVPDERKGDDLFLPYREMRMMFHGDRAAARVTGRDDRGRSEGAIVEVLERRTRQVAGRFSLEGGIGFVTPDNRRISQRVVVPREATGTARHGDLAVVEITEQPSRNRDPVGRVLRVLPENGGADAAIELAIASHGLSNEFPAQAVTEARGYGREVPRDPGAGREDLRALPLVTIDGEDARDFDDAVYAEPNASGFRLVVAIADVSHYVRPGTALDTEARLRATSVYFPNRVLPMLPEELSNHLCSLMPDVDRLCMVADMQVTRAGAVAKSRFYAAVMRSQARFTYTRVAAHLEGRDPLARGPQARLAPVIDCLHQVFHALRKEREKRGALDFEAPEVKVLVDAAGNPTEIRAYPRNDAHRLIEECMIAANVQAAGFLKKHKLPALYRIHGKPDEERIEELKRFLSMRGVLLEIGGDLKPARLQKVLAGISGRPDAAVLENAIIRSLPQALYQPLNIGHFGLALAEYAHFTSPIRRYPDLLVHRGIRHALGGGTAASFVHSAREMEALGTECSLRERRADEAARSVVAWLKCEYMRPRIGEEFDAVVTGVTDFGLFVQLKDIQVDGLVHVTALPADYFHFHEADRTLVGARTRLRFSIGDELRVRLAKVDSAERKIDFEHVAKTGTHHHPRRRAAKAPARHK
ncbi:MAG TPA: ribonuclease R [Steroidobacteraceae bacterium]|nr:ribonuclease R [Steroidobacteraceae bacterium]